MITDLSQKRSSINHYVTELRDKKQQRDSYLFRQNIKLMGTLLAYEASKELAIYFNQKMCIYPTIVNVLRAGNQFVVGVLDIFRKSKVAFYGVSRDEKTLISTIYYEKTYNPNHEIIIIPDIMLATGASLEVVIKRILNIGTPEQIIILSCIAHMDGIN